MKKLLCAVLSLMLLLSLCGCSSVEADLDIWIATDNHYLSPALHDGGEHFMEIISNADGKVTHYSDAVTDTLLYEATNEKPDVLILSGDLTLNGAVKSHEELCDKLKKVEAAGVQVLVIPGNHDVDSTGISFVGEEYLTVDSLTSEKFPEYYKDFGYSEAISRDENSFSYIIEAEGKLRILMLDTNSYGKGYVNDETYVWLEQQLKSAKDGGYRVMSVTHQNLFAHNELLSFGYQLYDADELIQLYKEYGVKCNFSGHIHVQSILEQDGITEIVSSSTTMAPIQYGKIHYDGKKLNYTVDEADVSGWAEACGKTDENLLDFKAYATKFFEDLSTRQVYSALAETDCTEEEKALMAETFAKINTKYFAGEALGTDEYSEGVELWRKPGDFFIRYIETMINAPENRRNVSVDLTEN